MCITQFKRDKMFGILLASFLTIGNADAHPGVHHSVQNRQVQHPRPGQTHRWIWIAGHWEIRGHKRIWVSGHWKFNYRNCRNHHRHHRRNCR